MMDDTEEQKDIIENLSDSRTWMRLLYMILYGIVFEIGKFVGLIVALVQFLFALFTGKPLPQLQKFGYSLAEFYRQIIEFQTFRSEARPYPWAPWPQADEGTPKADPKPSRAKAARAKKAETAAEDVKEAPAKPAKATRKRKKSVEQVSHTDDDAPSA